MHENIIEELNNWAYIIDNVQGKANVVFLSGDIFKDAADEIKKFHSAARLMAGTISSMPKWDHMHPEEVLNMYLQESVLE